MRKLYHLTTTTFLIAFLTISFSVIGQNPFGITLLQPDPVVTPNWVAGETYTISWVDNLTQPVEVGLYDGAVWTLLSPPGGVIGSTFAYTLSDGPGFLGTHTIRVRSTTSPGSYYVDGDFVAIAAPANSITVIQPSVADIIWARGTSHLISWTDNINENVNILLSSDGGTTYPTTLASSVEGSTWTWAIDANLAVGTTYKIKVESETYSTVLDFSDFDFEITATTGAFTEIYQPITSTSWAKSTTHLISWNDNIEGPVNVFYFNNDVGTGIEEIATDVVGSTYAWTIPLLITGANYNIILQSTLDPSIEITSNNFEITQTLMGGITAIYQPIETTSWTVGTTQLISWLDNLNEPINVYYSNDGGAEQAIALNVQGTTLAWDIPSGLTTGVDKCKVILRSTLDPSVVYLESDLFDLTASSGGTSMTVIQPSVSGISWAQNTEHYISWDNDFTENVKIELVKFDDATTQTTPEVAYDIVDDTPGAPGSTYVWDIVSGTYPIHGFYKVRITSVYDPLLTDMSDNTFAITGSSGTFINTIEPSGGEYWMYGTSHWISWLTNCTENVYIYLDEYDKVSEVFQATRDIESATVGTTTGVPSSMYSWTINQAGIDTTHKFKIRVVSTLQPTLTGSSADYFYIVPVGKTPTSSSSLDDIASSVMMYPNPTKGNFVVSSTMGISNIEVLNLYGQVVYSKEVGEDEEVRVDMTNHDSGIYIVNVLIQGKVITKKLFAY